MPNSAIELLFNFSAIVGSSSFNPHLTAILFPLCVMPINSLNDRLFAVTQDDYFNF